VTFVLFPAPAGELGLIGARKIRDSRGGENVVDIVRERPSRRGIGRDIDQDLAVPRESHKLFAIVAGGDPLILVETALVCGGQRPDHAMGRGGGRGYQGGEARAVDEKTPAGEERHAEHPGGWTPLRHLHPAHVRSVGKIGTIRHALRAFSVGAEASLGTCGGARYLRGKPSR
jgi:hypothetical protein